MNITLPSSMFSDGVATVARAMGTETPIMAGILIRAMDGRVDLEATDGVSSIRHSMDALVTEPGQTVLSGKLLGAILKELPDGAVELEAGPHSATLTCAKAHYELNCLDAKDFPGFPGFSLEKSVEIPADVLGTMADAVCRCASKEHSRPVLRSVQMKVEGRTLRMVSTDSYRLMVVETQLPEETPADGFEMLVPADFLKSISGKGPEKVLLGYAPGQVVAVRGKTTYVSRSIEGNFPVWRSLFPQDCKCAITVDHGNLAGCLARASVVTREHPQVRLDVIPEDGQLIISGSDQRAGMSRDVVDVEVEGKGLSIGLNSRYFNDLLQSVKEEGPVHIELTEPERPAVMFIHGAIEYRYLLMPVRI